MVRFETQNSPSYYALRLLVSSLRLRKLSVTNWVCWDEAHFGKMAGYYVTHEFFSDVHPPLGKMLLAFIGHLTGFRGDLSWEHRPDHQFPDDSYLGMRFLCAIFGASLVPLVFLTVCSLSGSLFSASVSASFLLIDTGAITISRYAINNLMLAVTDSKKTMLEAATLERTRQINRNNADIFLERVVNHQLSKCLEGKFEFIHSETNKK